MEVKNRLKNILNDLGYKLKKDRQPLNDYALKQLGMTPHRVFDIIENRQDKPDLTIQEINALCKFFGVKQDELICNKVTNQNNEPRFVFCRVQTEMILQHAEESV